MVNGCQAQSLDSLQNPRGHGKTHNVANILFIFTLVSKLSSFCGKVIEYLLRQAPQGLCPFYCGEWGDLVAGHCTCGCVE